jgi:hypothetical protein
MSKELLETWATRELPILRTTYREPSRLYLIPNKEPMRLAALPSLAGDDS